MSLSTYVPKFKAKEAQWCPTSRVPSPQAIDLYQTTQQEVSLNVMSLNQPGNWSLVPKRMGSAALYKSVVVKEDGILNTNKILLKPSKKNEICYVLV